MASDFDMRPHQEMWHRFTRLMFWSAAVSAVVLALMGLTLTGG